MNLSPKTTQLFELMVFLFLIIPSMILSLFVVGRGAMSFFLTAVGTITQDLALVSLVLFFIWRNGEPIQQIGWTVPRPGKEIAIGIVLFVPFNFFAAWMEKLFVSIGLSSPATPLPALTSEKGAIQYLIASVMVMVVAFAEETIFRGYLMLRFNNVTGSLTWAVLLSSGIFCLGHGYEGSAGVLTVFFMGLMFALIYAWRKSLAAPMVIHFLQDFIAVVIVPLFFAKS